MPRSATAGRNTGSNVNPAKVVTSPLFSKPTLNTNKRLAVEPKVTVYARPQLDILDHGLEDAEYHYVWVNPDDPMRVNSYWLDDYRFVKYEDVKDQLTSDERRAFLYTEDALGRVALNELRLMRLSQTEFQRRTKIGLSHLDGNPAERAKQDLESKLEHGKYAGTLPPSAKVNGDADNGSETTTTIEGDNE